MLASRPDVRAFIRRIRNVRAEWQQPGAPGRSQRCASIAANLPAVRKRGLGRAAATSLGASERWSKHRRSGVCGWFGPGGAWHGTIDRQFSVAVARYGLSGRRALRRGSRERPRAACPALGTTRFRRHRQRRRWRRRWRWGRHVAVGPAATCEQALLVSFSLWRWVLPSRRSRRPNNATAAASSA